MNRVASKAQLKLLALAVAATVTLTGCIGAGGTAAQSFTQLNRVDNSGSGNLLVVANANQQAGIDELNADRVALGLAPLTANNALIAYAQVWAEQLASESTIYHSTLPGVLNDQVNWSVLGENVGMGPSIAAIQGGYMASPSHRANVLGTDNPFTQVGVGVALNAQGKVFTVQIFMVPR